MSDHIGFKPSPTFLFLDRPHIVNLAECNHRNFTGHTDLNWGVRLQRDDGPDWVWIFQNTSSGQFGPICWYSGLFQLVESPTTPQIVHGFMRFHTEEFALAFAAAYKRACGFQCEVGELFDLPDAPAVIGPVADKV